MLLVFVFCSLICQTKRRGETILIGKTVFVSSYFWLCFVCRCASCVVLLRCLFCFLMYCWQTALLYTTSCGERRIRVHNLAVPVETVIQNVFDSVNIDVLCNILAKQALEVSLKSGLDNARGRIQQACIDIVRASRGGGYGASPYMAQQQVSQSYIFCRGEWACFIDGLFLTRLFKTWCHSVEIEWHITVLVRSFGLESKEHTQATSPFIPSIVPCTGPILNWSYAHVKILMYFVLLFFGGGDCSLARVW